MNALHACPDKYVKMANKYCILVIYWDLIPQKENARNVSVKYTYILFHYVYKESVIIQKPELNPNSTLSEPQYKNSCVCKLEMNESCFPFQLYLFSD